MISICLAYIKKNDMILLFFFLRTPSPGEIQLGSSCEQKAALPWAGWVWLHFSVCKMGVLRTYFGSAGKNGQAKSVFC